MPTRYFWIASVCVFTASFVQAFVEEISAGYENVGLANAVAVCTIIINIVFYVFGIGIVVLDVFRKKYREESILKEQYLQIAKNYVKTVRNNAKETRKMRHDMKNHMNILSYHLEQGENQKALTYLSEIQSHMDQSIKKTVSVNHEIVDAILSQMQSESERQKIRWEIEGSLPADLPVGDFDLCTIFSNLLSNSIEACTNVEESERSIYLAIRRLGEQLVIEVENSSSQSVEVGKLGNMTSKKDVKNHGYGILNIKDAVRKNHGEILFESLEGRFAVRIIFPLSEKATVYF
ncbi:MAG: GHKL domain-containing protein [Lachnospiraceae bacterium]|nr:GHKL domain-containing protein [Lachnospiraceae bacterium]